MILTVDQLHEQATFIARVVVSPDYVAISIAIQNGVARELR